MNSIIIILLILFYFSKQNYIKSAILIACLVISIYSLNNSKENFEDLTFIEKFIKDSETKNIVNKCCTKDEIKLIEKKIKCIINSKDTYKLLMDNANKIMPSKESILDILTNYFL